MAGRRLLSCALPMPSLYPSGLPQVRDYRTVLIMNAEKLTPLNSKCSLAVHEIWADSPYAANECSKNISIIPHDGSMKIARFHCSSN